MCYSAIPPGGLRTQDIIMSPKQSAPIKICLCRSAPWLYQGKSCGAQWCANAKHERYTPPPARAATDEELRAWAADALR